MLLECIWDAFECNIRTALDISKDQATFGYRYPQNFWVISSNAIKARLTPKDAEFCQVYFSHRNFLGVSSRSLVIRSFLRSDRKMLQNSG